MSSKGYNDPESPQYGWADQRNSVDFKQFSCFYKLKKINRELVLRRGDAEKVFQLLSCFGLIYYIIYCITVWFWSPRYTETWFGFASTGSIQYPVSWSNSSDEASTSLCCGSHGLALYQSGVWDMALQHFLHTQTGAAPTLRWRAHPLGLSCLWVSLLFLRRWVTVQWMALAH